MPASSSRREGDAPSSPPLFTFAILADTHIRAPDGDPAPFAVDDLANDRARYAVAAIAAQEPDFTVHLGDMVHPQPPSPSYGPAAREALSIVAPLKEELRYVPGNCDVGDKPMAASPAAPADANSVVLYEQHFGPGHYSFDHRGVHFVVINASLVNSGTDLEKPQRRWLEADLKKREGKRIVLFTHYPPFIDHTGEAGHYDNYEEPGRSWLLYLVRRYAVEAVFSAHTHQFFFNRLGQTNFYCLPPTSFTRQDYGALYGVDPAPEFGRNDEGKLGYALVDILDEGHRVRLIPTDGRLLGAGEALETPDAAAGPPRGAPFVVHLRHGWARATDLPYNGPLEEFARKRARNDTVLARLWQMGIARVRTPLADLLDPEYGRRIDDFYAAGCRFTFFGAGLPGEEAWKRCRTAARLIDAVEVVACENDLSDIAGELGSFDAADGPPVWLGKFHSAAQETGEGAAAAPSGSFGFAWEERDAVLAVLRAVDTNKVVQGVVFQVNLEDDLGERLAAIDAFAMKAKLMAGANIRLANVNPAVANADDAAIEARIRQAVDVAATLKSTTLQLDTFADIDRGYHPRHGLVDGRCNFRPAGRFLAGLA